MNVNQLPLDTICRTCLLQKSNMKSLFDSSWSDKLMCFTDLNVYKGDGLPEQLCTSCIVQINQCYTFKQRCQKSDTFLREHIDYAELENKKYDDNISPMENVSSDKIENNEIITTENQSELVPCVSNYLTMTECNKLRTKVNAKIEKLQTFSCSICNLKFIEKNVFSEHLRIHWNIEVQECPVCKKRCSYFSLLVKHVKMKHNANLQRCKHCKKDFIDDKKLLKHNEDEHGITDPIDHCTVCGKVYTDRNMLDTHMLYHKKPRPFICDICGVGFSNTFSFARHLKTHRRFMCTVCSKTFSQKQSIDIHMRSHTGEKPYVCNICGKGSSTNHNLVMHMRTHSGEKPFKCPMCDYSASTQSPLSVHIKRHKGIKPFVCERCGKKFVLRSQLTQHMKYHTGERPHSCTICLKRFFARKKLEVHLRTHTGEKPYTCNICDKEFVIARSLREHLKIHVGDQL